VTEQRSGSPAGKVQRASARPKLRMVDGGLEYPLFEFRFLFADGSTIDVIGTGDDSTLREVVLAERGIDGDRIVGASDGRHVGWMAVTPRGAPTAPR